tara:strand:- start:2171 stop:2890 length:720 start_codon:yes stop_codon:yes gene_type:complete
MKVAISFIGTNKYLNFLPQYYENIEKYFLPKSEKTILAFTDGQLNETPENLKVFVQEHLDWPFITLKRFEIINKAREIISDHDWFVFIDADALVVDRIDEDEFFTDKPLFGVHHPCHFLKMQPHTESPGAYEQNPKSEAYVDLSKGLPDIYWQGCLWGGQVPQVCDMIDDLQARINRDLENDIVAVWHDESQINKYFLERITDVHTFDSSYAFPEVFESYCNFSPKIVHLAKDNSVYQK